MPFYFELPSPADAVTVAGEGGAAVGSLRVAPDVRIFSTPDGGEIRYAGGFVEMTTGLESAVYLSMFGGNAQDSGLAADDPVQWWGNLSEREPGRKMRSETQAALVSLPSTTANMARLRDAATRDLAWMGEALGAEVAVFVTMPGLRRAAFEIRVSVGDVRYAPITVMSRWDGEIT